MPQSQSRVVNHEQITPGILYVLDLKPLHEDLEKIHTVIGAIVNKGNRRGPWAARYVTAAFFLYREMPHTL